MIWMQEWDGDSFVYVYALQNETKDMLLYVEHTNALSRNEEEKHTAAASIFKKNLFYVLIFIYKTEFCCSHSLDTE